MINAHLICLILALISFLLAAVGVPATRVNLEALGLFFLTLAFLFVK